MSSLKTALIQLGQHNKQIRQHLVPILHHLEKVALRDVSLEVSAKPSFYGGQALLIEAYDKQERLGFLELEGFGYDHDHLCTDDVDALQERGLLPSHHYPIWAVYMAFVSKEARGTGIGSLLYRKALRSLSRQGSFYFMPWSCLAVGGTTSDAGRVWTSLKRTWPSEGDVLYVS